MLRHKLCYEDGYQLRRHSNLTVHREVEKLTKFWQFFQSFISPQIAAAQTGFLFLKALYLTFQMHTS